jgi:peroxiredoxin Q/BCP
MRKHLVGLLAVVGILTLSGRTTAAGLKPGDPAPPFKLQGSDGKIHELAQLKGKAVVLAWFPKAFTGGCTAECKSLHEDGAAVRKFDAIYFAVSTDDADTNKKFAESLSADYPILADPDTTVARAYGVLMPRLGLAYRWTFYIGPDGKILDIDKEVRPTTAGSDVAAKLEALKIAKAQ